MTIELKHFGHEDAGKIRELLLDIHAEVHSNSDDPFRARTRFAGFVDNWSALPSWSCVIGYDGGRPAGFAYGAQFAAGRWWKGSQLPDGYGDAPSFALSELMVLPPWRKQGVSRQLHEALVVSRHQEPRATLLVDVSHPKVVDLYESWGYRKVDEQKPFEDSPVFAVMVKALAND